METIPEPTPAQQKDAARAIKREAHEDQKQDLNYEIEIANLNKHLAEAKAAAESYKKKSKAEGLLDDFSECKTEVMTKSEITMRASIALVA